MPLPKYNSDCRLWPVEEHFFRDLELRARRQAPGQCVRTVMAMLTGRDPGDFVGPVIGDYEFNTQDPLTWSKALERYGMKLAYISTDCRPIHAYIPTLIKMDDLFLISYYVPTNPENIMRDVGYGEMLCSSHIVILHRNRIFDPMMEASLEATQHCSTHKFTKRIFRLVPADHDRGL